MLHDGDRLRAQQELKSQLLVKHASPAEIPDPDAFLIDAGDLFLGSTSAILRHGRFKMSQSPVYVQSCCRFQRLDQIRTRKCSNTQG